MLGLWNHTEPREYGNPESYRIAAEWLVGYGPVEDWGCGTRAAEKYLTPSCYTGIDGSGRFADVRADLRTYASDVHCILIRHVLEHNADWPIILRNAVASFRNRMALVMFLKPEEPERFAGSEGDIPNIYISKSKLLGIIGPLMRKTVDAGDEICFLLEK